ncbi:MAG TPA: hypothetical protein VHL10_04270 [Nitrososphaera sp.]|nr:hypothetical protein [Nitrososphaera sp.]
MKVCCKREPLVAMTMSEAPMTKSAASRTPKAVVTIEACQSVLSLGSQTPVRG